MRSFSGYRARSVFVRVERSNAAHCFIRRSGMAVPTQYSSAKFTLPVCAIYTKPGAPLVLQCGQGEVRLLDRC